MKNPFLIAGLALLVFFLAGWIYIHRSIEIENVPIILGHGGMGVRSSIPLDSKRSIQEALSYPINGTELDVKMTHDSVLVSFHDGSLDKATQCSGTVASKTFSELNSCQTSGWFSSEPISDLASILNGNWRDGTIFSLDLKPDEGVDMKVFVRQLNSITSTFPQYRFLIESQDLQLLSIVKTAGVNAELFYYAHEPTADIDQAVKSNLDGISIEMNLLKPEDVERAKNAGIKVMIWGCGDVFSNRKALLLSADIIQTDDIASMMRILP
ncbi:MAG: hypothetical protein K9J17_10975 [Flavobacteriales bacterium]|nr:hypothetical protein [Flavobacteriales bacterium]